MVVKRRDNTTRIDQSKCLLEEMCTIGADIEVEEPWLPYLPLDVVAHHPITGEVIFVGNILWVEHELERRSIPINVYHWVTLPRMHWDKRAKRLAK